MGRHEGKQQGMGNHPGVSSRREASPLLGLEGERGHSYQNPETAVALEKLREGLWP